MVAKEELLDMLAGFPKRWVVRDEENEVKGNPRAGAGAARWIMVPFLEIVRTGKFELNSL